MGVIKIKKNKIVCKWGVFPTTCSLQYVINLSVQCAVVAPNTEQPVSAGRTHQSEAHSFFHCEHVAQHMEINHESTGITDF